MDQVEGCVEVGQVIERSQIDLLGDESKEELASGRCSLRNGEDRLWSQDMDAVADEDPAALGLFEQVEVIGLVFEVHVCLDYKSHHDVEEADVVGEEDSNEEEFPPEGFVTLNEPRDEDRPAF